MVEPLEVARSFERENLWTSLFYFEEQMFPALGSKTAGCYLTWRRITSPSSRTVVATIIFPWRFATAA